MGASDELSTDAWRRAWYRGPAVSTAMYQESVHGCDERLRAHAILRRHGWASLSFRVLAPGFSYWFVDPDAFVAYRDTGAAWVVAGPPLAAAERYSEVAEHFAMAAVRARRRVCWIDVGARFSERTGIPATLVGEEPQWDARAWERLLASCKTIRSQVRRAANKGVTPRILAPHEVAVTSSLRPRLEALVGQWAAGRSLAPLGFLMQIEPFSYPQERRYIVAERGDQFVALLAAAPIYARRGWLVEHVFRAPNAPNGTAELLVDHLMRRCAAEYEPFVSLGLAPLHGPVPASLRWLGRLGRGLYDVEGLSAFRERLRPDRWEPRYLAYPGGRSRTASLYDVLVAATPRGVPAFAMATARHRVRRLR